MHSYIELNEILLTESFLWVDCPFIIYFGLCILCNVHQFKLFLYHFALSFEILISLNLNIFHSIYIKVELLPLPQVLHQLTLQWNFIEDPGIFSQILEIDLHLTMLILYPLDHELHLKDPQMLSFTQFINLFLPSLLESFFILSYRHLAVDNVNLLFFMMLPATLSIFR